MKHHRLTLALTASLLACSTLPMSAAGQAASASQEVRSVQTLAQGWQFQFSEAQPAEQGPGWQPVEVPHSWNRIGSYHAGTNAAATSNRALDARQGTGWYQLTLPSAAISGDQRLWLEFGAVSRKAEVWLNGRKLGAHVGGFSLFRVDATGAYRQGKDNVLLVKVDNREPDAADPQPNLPLAGDFFVHGGLYRPVRMIVARPTRFALADYGGSGVYAHTQGVADGTATVSVRARFENDGARSQRGQVVVRLVDRDGKDAARADRPVQLAARSGGDANLSVTLANAHLWHGVEDPYLYTLVAELRDARGSLIDSVSQPFGIRTMRLDADKGFFLNDKPYPLRGVGLHQDWGKTGWALQASDLEAMVSTIREMGANTIRLTHYQHGAIVHDLADKHGLVLWDEIPLVTAWTLTPEEQEASPALRDNARQQLIELIRQNYNHPSVAVWGIANEVDFGPNRPDFIGKKMSSVPDPRGLLTMLNSLAKSEDPIRATALANCCEDNGMQGVPDVSGITDTLGLNRYMGWYYGEVSDFSKVLDSQHAKHPAQPLALTEYGAGGATSQHTDDPRGGPINPSGRAQPEAYEAWLHEQVWPQIASKRYLWASWLWNSFDFATKVRREGDSTDINTKGLVTYDGAIRKDAWWYYRVNWSSAPGVQIAGKRYVDRNYGVADVKVYSNAGATELFLNGASLGVRTSCAFATCLWPQVRLAPGQNRLEARGRFATGVVSDTAGWTVDANVAGRFRIDSGAILAANGTARFGSDAFFEGGAAGTADTRKNRWAPIQPVAIAGTTQRDIDATFRQGAFTYRIAAQRGRYSVILHFVEPDKDAGQRVFDVAVNGKVMLRDLDIAQQAGGKLRAIERRFDVAAGKDGLVLSFVPKVGQAIVSAVEIVPAGEAR